MPSNPEDNPTETLCTCMQAASRSWAGTPGGNALLDYLKSLDPHALAHLTSCAGDDIIEAMNAFIHRLLGYACLPPPSSCAPLRFHVLV